MPGSLGVEGVGSRGGGAVGCICPEGENNTLDARQGV